MPNPPFEDLQHWPTSQFDLGPKETIWNIRFHYSPATVVMQEVGEETLTQQHMAEACDINNIMARYEETGLLDHVNQYQGDYGDFTVMPDFHTAMNKIRDAEEMFMTLPSKVREKFNNNPGEFVEFATNKDNLDAMADLGLAEKPKKSSADADNPEPKKAPKETPSDDGEKATKA